MPYSDCSEVHDFYSQHPDTAGLFSSIGKALKGAAKGVAKGVSTVSKVATAPITLPAKALAKVTHNIPVIGGIVGTVNQVALMPIALTQGVLDGGRIDKVALSNLKQTLGSVKSLAPYIATVVSFVPGVGTGVSAAIGAGLALAEGKSITEAMVAGVKGAIPGGPAAQAAFSVAQAAIERKPIDQIAIAALPISASQKTMMTQAMTAVKEIASGKNVSHAIVDNAIKSLPPQYSKAIQIGLAMGHAKSLQDALKTGAAQAGTNLVQNGVTNIMRNPMFQRAGSIPNILVKQIRAPLSAVPSATKAVLDAVKRNPALMASSRQLLAQAMRTNSATVNDAMAIAGQQRNLLPWRSMSPQSVAFIRKYVPNAPLSALRHPHTNIGGLDSTGTTYIVEKGDGPWAIAQKLTGNGNRWKELLDYNKDKKPTVDKNIWVGEPLNLPPSWQKQVKSAPPLVALPSVPVPTIAPTLNPITAVTNATTSIVPSILQAKAILAAWGKTDGINQSGITDYGLNPADFSTTMGPRDSLMLQSFQVWDNKTLNAGLSVNGTLDAATLSELQNWASARANSGSSAAVPTVSAGIPQSGGNLSVPVLTSAIPVVIPSDVIGGTAPTPTVAAKTASTSGGNGALIAGGAIVGGLLFGLPGALIGGAAGAAVS